MFKAALYARYALMTLAKSLATIWTSTPSDQFRTNVTFMLTRHSLILPFFAVTLMS